MICDSWVRVSKRRVEPESCRTEEVSVEAGSTTPKSSRRRLERLRGHQVSGESTDAGHGVGADGDVKLCLADQDLSGGQSARVISGRFTTSHLKIGKDETVSLTSLDGTFLKID